MQASRSKGAIHALTAEVECGRGDVKRGAEDWKETWRVLDRPHSTQGPMEDRMPNSGDRRAFPGTGCGGRRHQLPVAAIVCPPWPVALAHPASIHPHPLPLSTAPPIPAHSFTPASPSAPIGRRQTSHHVSAPL